MSALIDSYDAALFDLDGVVYLGPEPVEGAAEGIAELRRRDKAVAFVTNNAARRPETVVEHLQHIGVACELGDVVTSAQVTAGLVRERLDSGAPVLIVGTEALADEIRSVGMTVVESAADEPVAVVQGYDPAMSYPRLDEAAIALQHGAQWFVTNLDSTRPTDRGIVPGCGTQVDSVRATVDVKPIVSGKPARPLLDATVERLGVQHPIFVGDRIDTDIMGAVAAGMDSLFVFTGAHGVADLVAADESGRPTHIGWDLRALTAPARVATVSGSSAECGGQRARVADGAIEVDVPLDREAQLDALWAGLQLAWLDPGLQTDSLGRLLLA